MQSITGHWNLGCYGLPREYTSTNRIQATDSSLLSLSSTMPNVVFGEVSENDIPLDQGSSTRGLWLSGEFCAARDGYFTKYNAL